MTETSSLPVEERIERPPEIDDGALQRIWLIRPVEKAASPIIDHNLELINAANQLKRWYQGKIINTPRELLSTLLDPNLNHATTMLTNFFDTVKRFVPGAFPAHCDAVRELEFTTVRLIRTLMEIIDAPVFIEALRRVSNLFASLADQTNFMLSDHDLRQRINSRLRQLLESFGEISNVFHARERERDLEIAFRKLPPVTAEDVKNAAEDVKDSIDKARGKILKDTHELKEICDPAHEARRSNSRQKRKNRPSGIKEEFIKAALDEIDAHPNSSKRRCCYCVFLRWQKNRPDDVAQTYPKFQTFNSIVSRRLTSKSQS